MFEELDLHDDNPTVEEAKQLVKLSIECYKKRKTKFAVIIHGYGSSGVGGIIKERVRSLLKSYKEKKIIENFIPGEKFNLYDSESRELKNKCKDLEKYYNKSNEGVTIIEI